MNSDKSSIHISSMGCCVSRDITGLKKDKGFIVDRHIEHVNPLSCNYKSPLGDNWLTEESIKKFLAQPGFSSFQIRNVLLDINKDTYKYLFEKSSDYLILDMGCLSYPLLVDEQGRGITQKLLDRLKWSDDNNLFKPLSVSKLNDNELMEGLKLFLREILLHYPQSRIVLVEVYRVHSYIDKEGRLHERYPEEILTERQENPLIDNEIINRGMACLKKLLPDAHCIPFPQNTLGDEEHPWGMSTMHYREEYYDYAYRALRVITMGGEREKEKEQIKKMKLECEKKFKMLSGQITPLTENDCVDIDMELFRIIQKYEIYKDEPDLQEIYYGDFATAMFNELVDSLDGDIAVRGDEISVKKFIQKLEEDNNQKIMAVIDDAPNVSILDKITVPSSQTKNFDVIIITSKKLREQFIFESLRPFVKGDIKIVDIYDYLESKGIYYRNTFYDEGISYRHITYQEVNHVLAQLEKAAEKDKSFLLRRLIAYCIEIKNFTYASQYIRRYIELKYENWENYQAFLLELQELFTEIKKNIHARKQGDIVINWIDNANAKELYESELGKHLRNKACFFTEAYTNCPWTHFTHNGIFTEKYAISGKTYNTFHHTGKSSKLLATLESKGYVFKYIANPGFYQVEFDDSYVIKKPKGFENVRWKAGGRIASECSTRLQWLGLKERLLSSGPLCLWIHNVAETHFPFAYISGDSFREYDHYRHANGLAFLAHELIWYSQFESPYQHSVYFDDHGDVDKNLSAYKKDRCNIGMIIKSYRVQPGSTDGLYSHVDFYKIIKELLSENEFDLKNIFSDYIIFENPDLYNETQCKDMVKHWRKINGVDMSYFQVIAIRTKKDLYAKYALGKEVYYLLPDEENNLIDSVEYRDRINYLKKLISDDFIDINKEEKFKHSHIIYDYLREVPEEKIKW